MNEIHGLYANIKMLEQRDLFRHFFCELSTERQQKIEALRTQTGRLHSLGAWTLFDRLLADHMGVRERELEIAVGAHRKPYVVGRADIQFNLSHSGDYVVCAVSDGEVGVDIQKWVPFKERTAERFFAPEEWKLLQTLPMEQRTEMFYRLWTRKEAYGKYTGLGIPDAVRENLLGEEECAGRQIRFLEMQPDQEYSIAVCVNR